MDCPKEAMLAVVGAEVRLLDPQVRRSRDQLMGLIHPDFVEIGASGRRWDRDSVIDHLVTEESSGVAHVFDMNPVEIASGVVQLRYAAVRGSRRSERSSIWLCDEVGWRVWFHQGTPVGSDASVDPEDTDDG